MSSARKFLLKSGALAVVFSLSSGAAQADWTKTILDERCDPEISDALSEALRDSIEASVRRAEASIAPPTPVGDLGCLNDLMTAPLDTFSNIGGMLGSLSGGLSSLDVSNFELDIDVSGMVCKVAAEKWAELTEPLSKVESTFKDFAGTASSAADRLSSQVSSFIPGMSGSRSYADSSGYSGNISEYTPPSTQVSEATSSRPIYPEYTDRSEVEYDGTEMENANNLSNIELAKAFADYLACRLSGPGPDGTWGLFPRTGASCTFAMVNPPIWTFPRPQAAPASVPQASPASVPQSAGAQAPDPARQGASSRPDAQQTESAPDQQSTGPSTIWQSLSN